MVERRVGKAQKRLFRHGVFKFVVVKKIWGEPIRVVSADGAENCVDLRVAERVQQVLRAVLGVRGE